MDKQKIFISSVQREFAEERKMLCNYIRQDAMLGRFFDPFLFEELPAKNSSAQQAYLSEVKNSDIYLCILGQRYGSEDEQGVSPTEKEFDEATAQDKYRICFTKSLSHDSVREPKQQAFVEKVEQVVVRKSFIDYEDLQSSVYASLINYLEEKELFRTLPYDASNHPDVTFDDIEPEKIKTFIRKANAKRNLKLDENMDVKSLLTHLDLLDSKGRLTNAAILLFGKKPQRFFISSEVKCIQFYGNDMVRPVPVYHIYNGDLFELINQAVAFVMSRIDLWVGTRDKSTSVDTKSELPVTAVTEAIVNAIAHRDYTSKGSVQVMLFRNRLEVWNPGTLPKGMTIEKLYEPHNSLPVNPLIAHPLFLSGDIEKSGTGTGVIVESCLEMGLKKPEFVQDQNFNVTIWRTDKGNVHDGTNSKNEGVNEGINLNFEGINEGIKEDLSKIYLYLQETKQAKHSDIKQIIDKSDATIERYLKILKDNDVIEYVGSKKTGGYRIK
jgi:predicted HTH transcriptional regulator